MNDKTRGEYKRTTPGPDETTGEALARLQAEMTRLLDEADADLRDEADGGVTAALIEKEAEEGDGCTAGLGGFICTREKSHGGHHIAATVALHHSVAEVWDQAERHEKRDAETHPGGLSASEWKILAVSYGREMDSAREYAEETGEFAALWKETAREHVRRFAAAMNAYDQTRAQEFAAVARAEKAEKERDEARRHECSDLDAHWRLDEALETIQQLARERDEARATKNMHKRRADEERARADAAVSRPLTPDVITDEMVERGRSAYWGPTYGGSVDERVRAILTAALTEPPARPEGAERWEDFLIDSLDYQALTDQQIADLADRIAEEMNR